MTMTEIELVNTLVRPALIKSFVYDISDYEAAELLRGGTIWARIKGESSAIHLADLDTNSPRVALGWAREKLDSTNEY